MLEKQQKNKKGKKVHAVFYQVGFIYTCIDIFILKNMGAAIFDFRVWPPLVKCQNIMFSGFIDTLMYGFSSTGVLLFNFIQNVNLITPFFLCLKSNKKTKKEKKCMQFFIK
jgi:hypothetical protein